MIKSVSIPTKWATHKLENDYTTEVIPQRENSESHVKLPSLRVLQQEESPESDFEGQKGLICRASTGLRETETFGGRKQNLFQGERSRDPFMSPILVSSHS